MVEKNLVFSTLESMLEGYQIIDREMRYAYVNKMAAIHGKTTPERLIGQFMHEVYPGIENTEVYQAIRLCHVDRHLRNILNQFTFPDQTIGWFELRIQAVPAGVLVLSIDVTEREKKRIENETLKNRMARTEKLETLGSFASGVTHDFNNMLTIIQMNVDLVEQNLHQKLTATALENLNQIKEECQRASRLTQSLLKFSAGKLASSESFDLRVFFQGILPMLKSILRTKVKLELNFAPELALVKISKVSLEQIILNLAINSADAMPNGGGFSIRVSKVSLDEEYLQTHGSVATGDFVLICIHDTGEGIPAEIQAKIFEPYFTTKPYGKGTGLGLAVVYGAVKQAGGFIEVYSQTGEGTAFKIYLPVPETSQQRPGEDPAVMPVEALRTKALLLEDDPKLGPLIHHFLAQLCSQVTLARSCQEAATALHENQYDLLICDMTLPDGSGVDVALSAQQKSPGMKVILMSGYSPLLLQRIDRFDPKPAILEKPFSFKNLKEYFIA